MAAKKESVERLFENQPEVEDLFRLMMERMAHVVMDEEVRRHLGVSRYERSPERRGRRNGVKPRTLNTRVGQLQLQVPQVRDMAPYQPSLYGRWERSERALLAACAEMYYAGVSTRKVSAVLEEMGGFELSAATVSRIAGELDQTLSTFRERPLDHTQWPHLIVDATYVKVRHQGKIVSRAALTVAGVNSEGMREICAWQLGDSESQETWSEIFCSLKRRGLKDVQTVTSDGHEGIQAAVRRQFPDAQWQRCRVHFLRNALCQASGRERFDMRDDLQQIFRSPTRQMSLLIAEEVAAKWEARRPRLARQIRDQVEECLTVHEMPPSARRKLHSTNLLERLHREIKRRVNVIGIFPNMAAADRLVGAQLLEQHEKWCCEEKRYIASDGYE